MITLTPRLAAVAAYVLTGEPMADIGTDHAYLPTFLIQSGAVPRAIAADILTGPLEAARSTAAAANLLDAVELRLGSGLRVLRPGEVATAAICGMGGALIADILADGPLEGIRRLVLQPMGSEEHLRRWLADHGWRLVAEQMLEDAGRLYVILVAEPGPMSLTELEAAMGPFLLAAGGSLLVRHAQMLRDQARRALAGTRRSERPEAKKRADQLEQRIRLLEEVIDDADGNGR